MKKGISPTYDMSFIIIELIMVILLSVFVFRAVTALLAPDENIAILNTEILRSKINQACLTGDKVVLDKFVLSQPKPSKLFGISDVLPKFSISASGDPHYILYYEAFPIGEGISWDYYQNFQNRIIVPYKADELSSNIDNDIAAYVESVSEITEQKFQEPDFIKENEIAIVAKKEYFVNNILLSPDFAAIPANANGLLKPEDAVKIQEKNKDSGFGDWNIDGNKFVFTDYRSLTPTEKSFIKYRPCGENTLCLKTRNGVYKFPLDDSCSNIDYVQLVYDTRGLNQENIVKMSTGALEVVGGVLVIKGGVALLSSGFFSFLSVPLFTVGGGLVGVGSYQFLAGVFHSVIGYKVSDFYLASPCIAENIEIEKVDNCNAVSAFTKYSCKDMIKYPIYDLTENGGSELSEHYTCIDSNGDEFSDKDIIQDKVNEASCIRIKVKNPVKEFCFTRNPQVTHVYFDDRDSNWASFFLDPFLGIINNIQVDGITKLVSYIGGLPVKDSSNVIYDENENKVAFLLKPSQSSEEGFNKMLEFTQKAWSWGWP